MGLHSFCLIFGLLLLSRTFAADAEVLEHSCHISVRNGKLQENTEYKIRINNRGGEEYTEVAVHYSKLDKLAKLEAWLEDPFGNVIKKLKPGDISEYSAISDISLYEDDMVKVFTLKHNIYPYILCYRYQYQRDQYLALAHWQPVLDRNVPTLRASLTIEIPKGYRINYFSRNVKDPTVDSTTSPVIYRWNTSYETVVEPEIFSPPFDEFLPTVEVVPQDFKFELAGSFRSWRDFGNWQYALIQEPGLPSEEKEKISSLIANVPDTREKIRTLYQYLQDQTRYINVSIETGGLKPYPSAYVAKNKYGDCKGLSNYFKHVLAAAGIKAHYVKIFAGEIRKYDHNFPSQQFNHVILCVPVQDDTLWVDCTSDNPYDYVGTSIQNREAFVIDKDNSHFARTPALTSRQVLDTRKVMVEPETDLKANAIFTNIYRGESYEKLHQLATNINASTRDQYIRNILNWDGFELTNYDLKKDERNIPSISLSYSGTSPFIYKKYGNELLISVLPASVPDFKDPKLRKLPVQIDYPICQSDTIEYMIPAGFFIPGKPADRLISAKFGEYSIHFEMKNGAIAVIRNFLLNSGNYNLDEYKDLYAFIRQVKDLEKNNYIVTKKTPQ